MFGALGLVIHTGAAGLDYDETVDGDLSGDQFNPTVIALDLGANVISGTTIANPVDREFFTFNIGAGQTLESLVLTALTPEPSGGQAFFALDDAATINDIGSANGYMGTALLAGNEVGLNTLVLLGQAELGGDGFDGSLGLGEGTYTFWYQEVSGPTSYTFTANLVPEPGSAVALLLGIGGLMARRRR